MIGAAYGLAGLLSIVFVHGHLPAATDVGTYLPRRRTE